MIVTSGFQTSTQTKWEHTASSHQEHGGSIFCIQAAHDDSIVVQSGTPATFQDNYDI